MAATIYDVAKKAGVSTATVSKVLSNTPYVSEPTRARVLDAVDELEFVPSLVARGLSKAQTFILALVIPYTPDYLYSDPHLLELIRGIDDEARLRHYSLLLSTGGALPVRRPADRPAGSGPAWMHRGSYVDGVLLIAASALGSSLAELGFAGRPAVSIGYSAPAGCATTVHADDRQGAHAATRHLIDLGHQRIGAISATRPLTALARRLEGYRQALGKAGLPVDPALIAYGDFSPESGYQAAGDLLAQHPRPTAIFAFNDRMAMGAIRCLRDAGLSVPHDIAVVGFDDIPAAALADPPLTTVRQPAQDMGASAARLLFERIEHNANGLAETVLPTELVIRASCGAPAAPARQQRFSSIDEEVITSLHA
jgi:DNA-binding LacI/PurR family transcriptional regulator